MEFEEHSEEEMGMGGASYDDPSRVRIPSPVEDPTMVMRNNNNSNSNNRNRNSFKGKYKECQKNHAVSIGGYSLDGCCEFIAAGAEGTLEALKCAACNCHRNFHRKETAAIPISAAPAAGEPFYPPYHHNRRHTPPHFAPPSYRAPAGYLHVAPGRASSAPSPAPTATLALPSASGGIGGVHTMRDDGEEEVGGGGGGEGVGVSNPKKRFRTKFTQEQKEKMLVFAERLGWRMQKHDDGLVQEFCNETGVKRNVLKVWMHNNKHTLGKKP